MMFVGTQKRKSVVCWNCFGLVESTRSLGRRLILSIILVILFPVCHDAIQGIGMEVKTVKPNTVPPLGELLSNLVADRKDVFLLCGCSVLRIVLQYLIAKVEFRVLAFEEYR